MNTLIGGVPVSDVQRVFASFQPALKRVAPACSCVLALSLRNQHFEPFLTDPQRSSLGQRAALATRRHPSHTRHSAVTRA